MLSRFRSFTYLLPQLWRALFTRPITVRFPFAPLELPGLRRTLPVDEIQDTPAAIPQTQLRHDEKQQDDDAGNDDQPSLHS